MTQLPLLSPRNRVPAITPFTGRIIDGFRIVTASSLAIATDCIAFARCRGSVGGEDYHYEVAGPEVMVEDRKIVAWAIVERL